MSEANAEAVIPSDPALVEEAKKLEWTCDLPAFNKVLYFSINTLLHLSL